MSDPHQDVVAQPWGALDVLAKLREAGPAAFPPDRIRTDGQRKLIELQFDDGPGGVVAWADALGLPRPENRSNADLRQTMVEVRGEALGWQLEIRHVHTAPSQAGSRHSVPA